jgi:hypothetical protein
MRAVPRYVVTIRARRMRVRAPVRRNVEAPIFEDECELIGHDDRPGGP